MDVHRKVELQSPADLTYLYANTVAVSRQKLDLHLPPSANNNNDNEPDPMRERVRELVDEFITQTFTSASSSISINGLDSSSPQFPFPDAFTAPTETVEYESYDTDLAARVTSLYAQLESLTTTVAQLRRDAPGKAAKEYAEGLKKVLEEDDEDEFDDDDDGIEEEEEEEEEVEGDVEMADADGKSGTGAKSRRRKALKGDWKLDIPLGTDHEADRWRNGDMAGVYEDALRTLLRLQGEAANTDASDGNALATTVGKAERASRAVDVVDKM